MKHNRGRWVAAIAGVAVLLVAGLLALEWREVQVRYHIWRLDRTVTSSEAGRWLEALERDAKGPGMAESIVRKLGHGHQHFTFWSFELLQDASSHTPLIQREACRLMGTDEALLHSWIHFLRWRKDPLIRRCLTEFQKPASTVHSLFSLMTRQRQTDPVFAGFDKSSETGFRSEFLKFLGALWFLGMDELPGCPELDTFQPDTWKVPDELNDKLNSWIKERRASFRFDPRKGRFAPKATPDAPAVDVPEPTAPLPDWSGPIIKP